MLSKTSFFARKSEAPRMESQRTQVLSDKEWKSFSVRKKELSGTLGACFSSEYYNKIKTKQIARRMDLTDNSVKGVLMEC